MIIKMTELQTAAMETFVGSTFKHNLHVKSHFAFKSLHRCAYVWFEVSLFERKYKFVALYQGDQEGEHAFITVPAYADPDKPLSGDSSIHAFPEFQHLLSEIHQHITGDVFDLRDGGNVQELQALHHRYVHPVIAEALTAFMNQQLDAS